MRKKNKQTKIAIIKGIFVVGPQRVYVCVAIEERNGKQFSLKQTRKIFFIGRRGHFQIHKYQRMY